MRAFCLGQEFSAAGGVHTSSAVAQHPVTSVTLRQWPSGLPLRLILSREVAQW